MMKVVHVFGWSIALVTGLALVAGGATARAEEWEESTPYYEDDAWYDVSEWFDGNDYNPTDEVVGRWDNETYQAAEDTGTDVDNDWGMYSDGFTDDDWYYDYYDDDYDYDYTAYDAGISETDASDDYYREVVRYYDFDNDAFYDAYAAYYDWDGDGFYEDVDYFGFNEMATKDENQQKAKQEAENKESRNSRAYTVTGTIQKNKTADVGDAKHTIVLMEQEGSSRDVAVDLGSPKGVEDLKLQAGREIRVRGPLVQIGDKPIVMARNITIDDESVTIDRSRRKWKGEVVDTREVEVRGQKHLLAIIRSKKHKDNTLAVDLGVADKLEAKPKKGEQIEVAGVPVKTKDKTLLIAQSFTRDGEQYSVDRKKAEKQ